MSCPEVLAAFQRLPLEPTSRFTFRAAPSERRFPDAPRKLPLFPTKRFFFSSFGWRPCDLAPASPRYPESCAASHFSWSERLHLSLAGYLRRNVPAKRNLSALRDWDEAVQNVLSAGNSISPINEVRGSCALIQMEMLRNKGWGGGGQRSGLNFFFFLLIFAPLWCECLKSLHLICCHGERQLQVFHFFYWSLKIFFMA